MTETKYATPEDVEALAPDMSEQFLLCRTYGHHWKPSTAKYSKDRQTIFTTQVCECSSIRSVDINARTGWAMHSRIDYADGYLTKGIGRIAGDAKGVLRLAMVQRSYGLRLVKPRKVS